MYKLHRLSTINSKMPIPIDIYLGLVDNNSERRKRATAIFSSHLVALVNGEKMEKIDNIVKFILTYLVSSQVPFLKNAGLRGLSAVAVALGPSKIHLHAEYMISGALSGAFMQNSYIRAMTCETLYNVAKVCKQTILEYSPYIFEVLSRLYSDPFKQVVTSVKILNGLIIDIFVEYCMTWNASETSSSENIADDISLKLNTNFKPSSIFNSASSKFVLKNETAFDMNELVNMFIKLVKERMSTTSSGTRLFLIEWLELLASVPTFYFPPLISTFLEHLLTYLCDKNFEVVSTSDKLLDIFLDEISTRSSLDSSHLSTFGNLYNPHTLTTENYDTVNFGLITIILANFLIEGKNETSMDVALKWIESLSVLTCEYTLIYVRTVIGPVFKNMSHASNHIRKASFKTSLTLSDEVYRAITRDFDSNSWMQLLSIFEIIHTFLLSTKDETINLEVIRWFEVLNEDKIYSFEDKGGNNNDYRKDLFTMLLYGLSSSNEAVYTQTFKIVCKAIKKESAHHGRISHSVSKIINFLYKDGGSLLKSLGYSIFKNISSAVGPEKFYISSSKILQQFSDKSFVKEMVSVLDKVLTTAPETHALRNKIAHLDSKNIELFTTLYKCWVFNTAALISLCMLAAAYEHAFNILIYWSTIRNVTESQINEITTLVDVLESPTFFELRLRLTRPYKYPYLLKLLCGLLMAIPKSQSLSLLSSRLLTANLILSSDNTPVEQGTLLHDFKEDIEDVKGLIDWNDLFQKFVRFSQKQGRCTL